jgi:Tetratricopeptide repeat
MKRFSGFLLALAGIASPAFAQTPNTHIDVNPGRVDVALEGLDSRMMALNRQMVGLDLQLQSLGQQFSVDYESGMRQFDSRKYDIAIQFFDRVISAKSARADGAMYWKAYAQNRLGKRDDALATIAQLRRDFPKSRWLDDAQALEVEVKQSSGKPVSPDAETNDELKLIAINGLMNADPDRAIPLLEGILKGTGTPRLKDRALFVLAQSRSPRAQQVLEDYAKGTANPDLQKRAMQYIGVVQTPEHQQLLLTIYAGTTNPEVKRSVVDSLFMAGAAAKLVELARKERDPEVKKMIVQRLSMMNSKEATDYMLELLK